MNNYCGFIEVWKGKYGVHDMKLPLDYFFLDAFLTGTKNTPDCQTIAIFKIKLK